MEELLSIENHVEKEIETKGIQVKWSLNYKMKVFFDFWPF
jgi:hypothetical protein